MSEYINALRDHSRDQIRLSRITDALYHVADDDQPKITNGMQKVAERLGLCEGERSCVPEVERFANHHHSDSQKVLSGLAVVASTYCHERDGDTDCPDCALHPHCPTAADLTLREFLKGYRTEPDARTTDWEAENDSD